MACFNQKKWFFLLICLSWSVFSYSQLDQRQVFSNDYLYLVGEMASLERQPYKAISYFKKAHKEPFLRLRLVQEYIKQGWWDHARRECLALLAGKPAHGIMISVRLLLAEVYASTMQLDRAITQYGQILNTHPLHKQALFHQTLLKLKTQPSSIVKIPDILNKNPLFHQHSGDIYFMLGDEAKAIQSFKKALKWNPSHRISALRLFQIYSRKGQYQRFTNFMEKQRFEDTYLVSLTARAYLRQGLLEKAQPLMENLLWDHPLNKELMAEITVGLFPSLK